MLCSSKHAQWSVANWTAGSRQPAVPHSAIDSQSTESRTKSMRFPWAVLITWADLKETSKGIISLIDLMVSLYFYLRQQTLHWFFKLKRMKEDGVWLRISRIQVVPIITGHSSHKGMCGLLMFLHFICVHCNWSGAKEEVNWGGLTRRFASRIGLMDQQTLLARYFQMFIQNRYLILLHQL